MRRMGVISLALDHYDEQEYVDQVVDRARKLVQTDIWDAINSQRLEHWLGCLENYNARLLGAYLLDNLCCRSRLQFLAMLDALFCDLRQESLGLTSDGRLTALLRGKPPKDVPIVLAPVIGLSAPPTKSGPYILRLCARRYRIHPDWLAWPANLPKYDKLRCLFFVDDFCGTGEQFHEFAESIDLNGLHKRNPEMRIIYLVATIHPTGSKKLRDQWPFIQVKCADQLVEGNSVMSEACFSRYEIPGFKEVVMAQYEDVVKKAGLPASGRLAHGFGDLGLAYAFTHATPNNTLPIFWYETPQWTPLLDR